MSHVMRVAIGGASKSTSPNYRISATSLAARDRAAKVNTDSPTPATTSRGGIVV